MDRIEKAEKMLTQLSERFSKNGFDYYSVSDSDGVLYITHRNDYNFEVELYIEKSTDNYQLSVINLDVHESEVSKGSDGDTRKAIEYSHQTKNVEIVEKFLCNCLYLNLNIEKIS